MLSFEQPFISLCHQSQMSLSLQHCICTKIFFREKLVGFQTLLVCSNKHLTGICSNKNYFSKLIFASGRGKVAILEGTLLAQLHL